MENRKEDLMARDVERFLIVQKPLRLATIGLTGVSLMLIVHRIYIGAPSSSLDSPVALLVMAVCFGVAVQMRKASFLHRFSKRYEVPIKRILPIVDGVSAYVTITAESADTEASGSSSKLDGNSSNSARDLTGAISEGIYSGAFRMLTFFGWFVIGGWAIDFVKTNPTLSPCVETKVVRSVGACSSSGNCGVEFSDGEFGSAHLPVPGKVICTRREFLARKTIEIAGGSYEE